MSGCAFHWLSMGMADTFRRSLCRWRVRTQGISRLGYKDQPGSTGRKNLTQRLALRRMK